MDGLKRNGSSESKNASLLRASIRRFFKDVSFEELTFHGNVTWAVALLATQTLFWGMSGERNVTAAHNDAKQNCKQLFGDWAVGTYQGLMKALVRYSPVLLPVLHQHLTAEITRCPGSRIAGYFAVAVDGSKPRAPRTVSNENRFVSKHYGNGKNAKYRDKNRKGKKRKTKASKNKKVPSKSKNAKIQQPAPNVLLTMFWSLGLQMPWFWTVGDATTTEKVEARNAIKTLEFPDDTLIVADAGFIGYELWQMMIAANLTFLIRAGANVHLKPKNKKLGLYYYRPEALRKQPPIIVRLVYIKLGKTKMAMVTNELSSEKLSKKQIRTFYELRWGVEIEFRNFKQTFECRKFRCHNADRVVVEAHWSLFAFVFIKLWTHQQLHRSRKINSFQVSFAAALAAIRKALNNHNNIEPPERTLIDALHLAIVEPYERKAPKRARYRPVDGRPKTGLPKIEKITRYQKLKLEAMLAAAA